MIAIGDIGLAFDSSEAVTRWSDLEAALDEYQRSGFRLVEINPFGTIIGGELRPREVERLAAVLGSFGLRYSLHGLERLNLAYDPRHELARAIMQAQIELCRRIGARLSLFGDDEVAEGAAREVAAFKKLAPLAADVGVTIGMENGDPHLWEYTVLDRFGVPREALVKRHLFDARDIRTAGRGEARPEPVPRGHAPVRSCPRGLRPGADAGQ